MEVLGEVGTMVANFYFVVAITVTFFGTLFSFARLVLRVRSSDEK